MNKHENIKKIRDFVLSQGNDLPYSDSNYPGNFHSVYYHWLDIHGISGIDPEVINNYASNIEQNRLINLNDPDEDGLINLDEFLSGTHPKKANLVCPLYKGLNLFPFHHPYFIDEPDKAYNFFKDELDNGDSLWVFDDQNQRWDFIRKDPNGEFHYSNDPNALLMENGKGYIIYRKSEEPPCKIIYQEETYSLLPLKPGINIRSGINLIRNAQINIGDSSFECLEKLRSQKIKSIIRYDSTQKTHHNFNASYLFFGRPSGAVFTIMKNEAYIIIIEKCTK